MLAVDVPVTAGVATVDLPPLPAGLEGGNAFAFVVADAGEPAVPIALIGEPLSGIALVELPPTATSTGAMTPAVVPPGGGTALGLLTIQSPVAIISRAALAHRDSSPQIGSAASRVK